MLTFENLSIKYADRVLLSNFCLTLFDGCCLNIIGANGSGKTTLIRTIADLHHDFSGRILFNDNEISEHIHEYHTLISYLGHKNSLDQELTVWDNLLFYAELSGMQIAIKAAVEVFGLEKYLDWPVKKLSAGWQKKVSLTRLLLSNSHIWLLDEPTANLDEKSGDIFYQMLDARLQLGLIAIISSHEKISYDKAIEYRL